MLTWNGSNVQPTDQNLMEDYRRVARDEAPHMTFRGYTQLANLEPETQEYLGLSSEYPMMMYAPPYKLFEAPDKKHPSQQLSNMALYHKIDPELGTTAYLVKATRDLKKNTAICFVGGQLMEEWKTEANLVDTECFQMKSQLLHDYFEYPRDGPNLVLHLGTHCNAAKFIRDPSHRNNGGEGPNVAIDLILHQKAKVVVLLLYTLEDIAMDQEIFCSRFVGGTKKGTHQNMVLAARVSHFYHRWATVLESAAVAANLSLDEAHTTAQAAAKKRKPKLLTALEQRLHMRGVDPKQKSVPIPPPVATEEHETLRRRLLAQKARDAPTTGAQTGYQRVYHFFQRTMINQYDEQPELAAEFPDKATRRQHIAQQWNALDEAEREDWKRKMKLASPSEEDAIVAAVAASTAPADSTSSSFLDVPKKLLQSLGSLVSASAPPAAAAAASSSLNGARADDAPSPVEPRLSSLTLGADSPAPAAATAPSAADLGYSSETGQTSAQIEGDLMRLMDTAAAFKHTGCEQIDRSTIGSSVTQPTRIAMLGIESPQYPEVLIIDGDKYPFDKAEMERMLDEKINYDPAKLEVREICGLTSPCRYFCPPWYRSFCVVSKVALRKGELLCIYSGEMEETVQHRCSSYVYHLPTREGVSHFGKKYSVIPDLMIDAAAKGDIGRFINDNMFRNGEYQDEAAANIGVTWVYDLLPHLVFYAKKDIGAGEELISSYGQEFWNIMCKQSMRGHSAFYKYIRPYTASLEKLLASRGVAVPAKPDVVIERNQLFEPKIKAYETPPEDSDDDVEEEEEAVEVTSKRKTKGKKKAAAMVEWDYIVAPEDEPKEFTVERIIGKRFEADGTVRYLVKWLCYDNPSDNTWEPLAHLEDSQQSLSEFELKLRRLGLKVGAEPLPEPTEEMILNCDDEEMAEATPTSGEVPLAAQPAKKKRRALAWHHTVPEKKVARKDLTREQLDAASIDLTLGEDEAAMSSPVAAASSSAAAASSANASAKGRKRQPAQSSSETPPPAKRRPQRKSRQSSTDLQATTESSPLSASSPSPVPLATTDSATSSPDARRDAESPVAAGTKQTSLASFFQAAH